MVARKNFVDQVMNKVGGNLNVAPVANASNDHKGTALVGYASDCAVNAELLCTMSEAMMAGQSSENVGPSVDLGVQGPSIGWSMLGTAASIGAVAVGGTAAAMAAPALAGVAAVAAVGEAIHFGLKQYAGTGAGELTMAAASKAAAAKSGESVDVYNDTSGDTYSLQGKKLAAQPVGPQPMNPFDQKLASATQEVLKEGGFTMEQAKSDVRFMMEKQIENHNWAKGKVDTLFGQNMMDITDAVGDRRVEMAMEFTAPEKKPALKALNVGMTGASAPSPGGMA